MHHTMAANTCGICLEPTANDIWTMPRCLHQFHRQCIQAWMSVNPVCPECRIPLNNEPLSIVPMSSGTYDKTPLLPADTKIYSQPIYVNPYDIPKQVTTVPMHPRVYDGSMRMISQPSLWSTNIGMIPSQAYYNPYGMVRQPDTYGRVAHTNTDPMTVHTFANRNQNYDVNHDIRFF